MGAKSKIEWTDATWNPIRARNRETGKVGWHCSHVTPGCEHCYAETMNKRLGTGLAFKPGHLEDTQLFLDEKMLTDPLRWRKPRKVFPCSMTDLFADFVHEESIDRMFAVMALTPQHTYIVLTKRAERMREYLGSCEQRVAALVAASGRKYGWQTRHDKSGETVGFDGPCWPLPNVILGVSVENQTTADERIPLLLETPAALRLVSYEPALGPVDFSRMGLWLCKHWKTEHAQSRAPWCPEDPSKWWWERQALLGLRQRMLDWIIVGGESGPGARPFRLEWARSVVEQCRAAGVACFVKQLGSNPRHDLSRPQSIVDTGWPTTDSKGGNIEEFPEDLRVREFPA